MSPEQAKGAKADARSDIFTVGIILYELLTGKSPYAADGAMASLLKRTQEAALPASQVDPAVPRQLSAIVAKCLERDVTKRYQTVDDLLSDLKAFNGGSVVSASRARRKRMLKKAKGYRGRRSKLFRYAKDAVMKAQYWAYRDRKTRKRTFRYLWIQRLNAAVRLHDMTYSRFIDGLGKAGIEVDRKVLSEMAIHEPAAFSAYVERAKAALPQQAA